MNNLQELAFPIHEMLGLPESVALRVERVSGPTTALTLRVRVSDEPGTSYFIKTLKDGTQTGPHLNLGLREVRFYDLIGRLSPQPYPNIPKCLSRFIAGDQRNYCLVLEDCLASHQSYETVDFSCLESWKAAAAALASFHQCFTGSLSQDCVETNADTAQDVERYITKLIEEFDQFSADHQGIVEESVLSLMARCIPSIRTFEKEKMNCVFQNKLTTILHRDAHLKNFLYPRSADGEMLIVDWQFWGLGIGTFDLRHLLGSALRGDMRQHQRALVAHYYSAYLNELDVDYSWEACWSDYRKGIIDNLFMPVWQYTGFGWGYDRWGSSLTAAIENYHTLECDQLGK
jgi:hypothetical protein